ncbi:MAG: TonB-dependent receptor plug domain-containing protein [Fermentimonas sp.]|nr:TonB-dependent receptor plug domain-containing protein [Fermentimonas sp.]
MSYKLKVCFCFIIAINIVGCKSLYAQYKTDSIQHLPEVIIIEKKGDRELRSSTPMQILTRESLQNLNALQLSDALKHLSGVTIKDYGGIGGLKTISVRGLGAAHTGIHYNGITISDVQTGQIDIGRFSLDNIDNITLHSGQSDQIFMPAKAFSNASYLNISTIKPQFNSNDKSINGKLSIKTGSLGLFNPSIATNFKIYDKLIATANAEWLSANGKYPYTLYYGQAGTDSSSVEKRENSDVQNLRLETAIFAQISKLTKGDFRVYYYQSERGLPGATIFYNTKSFSQQRLWDKTFFAQAHIDHEFSTKWTIQGDAKYNGGYLRYLDPSYLGETGKIEDIFSQNELYASISTLYKPLQNLSFSLASDITSATMFSERESFATPTRLTSHSAFAAKLISEQFHSTASLLFTQTFESTEIGKPAENRTKLSPHLSLSYKPFYDVDLRLRSFYKNSFRLPTFNDLYYPLVGLRNLKPENTNQFNIGATYSTQSPNKSLYTTLLLDAYHNRIKDKIIAYPSGNLHQWTMMNLGEVHINGLDISSESIYQLSQKLNLLFGISYTYQNAVDKTNPDKINYNHQIPYTPRHSGSVRTIFELVSIKFSYNLLWSGQRFTNGYNIDEFKLKGYTDHSVSLSKDLKISKNLYTAGIEALNILNKNYEIIKNYPMAGRTIRINLIMNY